MNEIIKAIFKEIFKKIANCARFDEVDRNTLSKRLYRKNSQLARIAFNNSLIDIREYSLMTYIQFYNVKNLSIISKLLM